VTAGGWIVMLVSVTSVVSVAAYCLYRTLKAPGGD
jgi:hypothetical protein